MLAPYAGSEAPKSSWSEDRIERLKQLWAEGLSASKIAADLGGITRNAVIGKANRLELPGRQRPRSIRVPKLPSGRSPYGRVRALPRKPDAPAFDSAAVKTLLELAENSCRWPLGDPRTTEFRFCGGDRRDRFSPYCAGHMRLATRMVWER